jgi:disulfide bond formation protein DsbB
MKKILILSLMLISISASAQHRHGHWHHGGGNPWFWVAPTVIGGVVGYEIARQQQPVVIQQVPTCASPGIRCSYEIQQPIPMQPICSIWTEVQHPDGTITRTRTCTQ